MFAANSLIFVPGSRPDRFARAKAAGAGLTVIDLEDAVPAADKDAARGHALARIGGDGQDWGLRINAVTTAAGIADLHALATGAIMPATILLPMVESPVEVEIVARVLGERCPALVPLVETPSGLRHAHRIAAAPGVAAMMFGGGDFSGELGVALAWEPLLAARGAFIIACAEAKVPAIDVPFVGLDDPAGLAEECAKARALGFAAKAAIHPSQVAAIEAAFAPSDKDVAEAARTALVLKAEDGATAVAAACSALTTKVPDPAKFVPVET
ncbi:MAG: HpcH/HpaI aldolase/citrate lyase family protein, partial [Novosphingobium sp.]